MTDIVQQLRDAIYFYAENHNNVELEPLIDEMERLHAMQKALTEPPSDEVVEETTRIYEDEKIRLAYQQPALNISAANQMAMKATLIAFQKRTMGEK